MIMRLLLQRIVASIILCTFLSIFPKIIEAQNQEEGYSSPEFSMMTAPDLQKMFYKTEINKKISVELNDETLGQALEQIGQLTGLKLTYRADTLPDKKVTLEGDMGVSDALVYMLDGTDLGYSFHKNGYLLISPEQELKNSDEDMDLFTVQEPVQGQVSDAETGESLPGVNIVLKGTTTGTSTNSEGNYELTVPSLSDTLVLSYVGYQTEEIPIEGRNEINVGLISDFISGEELIVIGYGTQRAEEVTGSISSVKSEDFVEGAVTDAAQLIEGKVAGLNVISPDANPTSTSQINLRGVNTLMSSSSPLVLINGVPGHLKEISPNEIESIDVLKGGSAAAIYGTRGSNGVILVTTKNVQGDIPPTIGVNSYINTQIISNQLDFMNANQYREQVDAGITGAIDQGSNTDWLDAVTQTPITHVHDINLKGGNQSTNYNLSLRYSDQNGIMQKSNNKTIYPRLEVNHTMYDGLIDIKANITSYEQEYYAGTRSGGYNPSIYYNAMIYNPTAPIEDENGNWFQNLGRHAYDNPVGLLEETMGVVQNDKLKYTANTTIRPTENLSIRILGSQDRSRSLTGVYETKEHTSNLRNSANGFASRGTSRNQEDLFEATAEYDNTFNNSHSISALAGYSWNKINNQNYNMENWDFPTDVYTYNNLGAGLALSDGRADQSSYQSESKLVGYFFRMNYNFNRRYLFSATIRSEGSTKFGDNHRWANFPAISTGWNVHNESFMENSTFFSLLRLRAGFGITGTAPSDPYLSLNNLNFDQRSLINGQWVQVNLPSSNPNPDLRWETKEEIDIGLDYGFLDDRVLGSIEVYQRTTRDMLWNYGVPSPPYLFSTITANAATMENKGIEVQVDASVIQTRDFNWNSVINFSTNRNQITSLSNDKFQLESGFFDTGSTGEPILQSTHRIEIGQPIGNFYGYKSVDIDDDGRWIIEGRNGEQKPIADQQAEDQQVIGNGLPDQYLNWNNTFNYKRFDLNINMSGAFGFQILNMPRMFYEPPVNLARGNVLSSAFDEAIEGRSLSIDQELQYVSHYIEDGDYWKLSNITLGYTLDTELLQIINSLRLYASASNVATITGYSGIDPEVSIAGLSPGIDNRHRYPSARSFTFGVSLTF